MLLDRLLRASLVSATMLSFLLGLPQVNNFDLANSLDLLAQLETEQTGHRKHLQQVIHALEGATVACRDLQGQTSRTRYGSFQLHR